MRHGEAQPYASSDRARQLTPRGIEEVQRNGQWLKQRCKSLDLVLVSTYDRARQTQQIICDLIDIPTRLEITEDLVPHGNAAHVHDLVDAAILQYHPENILLVSHMPLVSYLVETFSFEHASPIFPTAGIAHIGYVPQQMKGHFEAVKAP